MATVKVKKTPSIELPTPGHALEQVIKIGGHEVLIKEIAMNYAEDITEVVIKGQVLPTTSGKKFDPPF